MAEAFSLRIHVLLLWLLLSFVSAQPHSLLLTQPSLHPPAKRNPSSTVTNVDGNIQVFDPATQASVPQGPATDGSGVDFSAPAIIWIGFTLTFGLPLAFAGIRGWRLTQGAGFGFAAALAAWASLVNSVNQVGVSDIIIAIAIVGIFGVGFIIGLFKYARVASLVLLGVEGGLAFGIRIVLLRPGLLLSSSSLYAVNFAIIGILGVIGGLSLVLNWRGGILFGCASVGTFLVGLGVDLILNRQAGMSRGLRFLFDRNSNHLADIFGNGYQPKLITVIILIASLALSPILAYAQHKVFKGDFSRKAAIDDSELRIDYPDMMPKEGYNPNPSRFSL